MVGLPFDVNSARRGELVSTRDGRPVRIVCWDVKNTDFPILALVLEKDGREHPYQYTADGRVVKGKIRLEGDLVMVNPEEKKQRKVGGRVLFVKLKFNGRAGFDFLLDLASQCEGLIGYRVIGYDEMLLRLPFIDGEKLYSYMSALASKCRLGGKPLDFKCVYADDKKTFGDCGYYETANGMLLGTRFVNKVRQDKAISDFFTRSDFAE
jgi:hypothetical protein